jgi:UDP-3-O-[3-hydroxymyristoyl] glucosamine N-acyltransferase
MTQTYDFGDGRGPVPAHQHANGGGWVAHTATVHSTVYVGPNARISDTARISGSALISGNARVYGSAHIYGYASVYGNAHISGYARISDTARVYGSASVYGNAHIYGNARVYGSALIYGNAWVKRGEYTSTPTSITRSDGYAFTLQSDGSIVAGCQDKTQAEAFEYWGNPKHHKHAESIAIVNALYAIAKAQRQS